MKNKAIFGEFAKYTSLNVLGMIALSCYILADTFFVAKGLGANGLAALNLAIPIYSLIHGSGLMFGMGAATRYSILKSQSEHAQANRAFTTTILLALGLASLFFISGAFFSSNIMHALGADPAIFALGQTYLQVILLFAPMFMLNNVLLCFVRNDGAPQLSMMAMVTGSLSNVILDYIFIFPLKMGMFGAAFATGLAPVISILVLSPFFFKKKHGFHLVKSKLSWRMSSHILSSGLPSFLTEVSSGLVILVFNTILLGLQGNLGVAAYGVIANLSLVVISIYTGIAQGIQPLLSSAYGAENHAKVQTMLRYALITMAIVSLCVYSVVFFAAPQIASIFNSEQNALLQAIAVPGLRLYFTGCLFAGCNIILSVYFTSSDNPRPAHIISCLRGFLLVIPLAFFLAALAGLTGVWCVFPLTELLVCGIGLALYGRSKRKKGREPGALGSP